MDNDLFLQHLRDLSLEEGRAYIQEHAAELEDHAAFGNLLAAEARSCLYTPFISLKLAELLIFFGEYVQNLSSQGLGLKAKGDALVQIGHYQSAMQSLDAAQKEFLLLGDAGNAARSRISWILACAWLGRVEEALQEAARAREVFLRLGEHYWACVIGNNTALIYDQVGRYQDALQLYESMQAIYPTLVNQHETSIKRSIALAKMNQGVHLAWFGNFEQAYHLQQQARTSFITLNETSMIIHSEINLADLDYIQGYYGSALRRFYQTQDRLIHNNIDNPLMLAELKLCMGNCLIKLNRVQEACQLVNEAVAIYRQFDIPLSTGNALREYAITLAASGRLKEALAALNEAAALLRRGGFDPLAFAAKLQQAELLLEMGSVNAAYDEAKLVREYFEGKGLVARYVHASLIMASARIGSAQKAIANSKLLQEALLLCKQADLQSCKHNLQEEVYKSHYLQGQIFVLQANLTKSAKHFGAAITHIERILDDLAYDLSPSFLHTTWTVYEDMIALCLQQSQIERAFIFLEQARSMALRRYLNKSSALLKSTKEEKKDSISSSLQASSALILRTQQELKDWQERYHDYSMLIVNIDTSVSPSVDREIIQGELKRSETKISELFERLHLYQPGTTIKSNERKHAKRNTKQIDVIELRRHLKPDQLLLAYFLYKGKLVIFAITAEGVLSYEVPTGVEQLERLLPLLYAHLQPGGWPNLQDPPQQVIRRLLNKLYDLLIAPVTELLPSRSGSLTIVPFGPLHKLPFHALYDGSHFLIENFQINYLPASSILMHLGNHKDGQEHHFVDPAISSKQPLIFGYSGNGHLQRTLEEAKMLAIQLNGRCYLESEATISRLIEQAPGSPIIHIATHGHSRLDAPNFSYVLLADGQLNAIDAFSLDLKECDLVTLSGCETGLALTGGGDEQLGLGRAFLAAGAKSLVMSLWPVEDNSTNELMQLFYEHLLNGESKVQALRAAQCQLLHRSSPIYTHPYFWAAFRLVGDVDPLVLKEQDVVLSTSKLSR